MALRLAIIEDNPDLLDELLAWLGYRGFEVWGTRSAEAFWRQLHSHPVDIVLIDIGLPGEDGFSVLSYLHELGTTVWWWSAPAANSRINYRR